MSSMFSTPSSLCRYFGDSESSNICLTAACQPNMRKKGASLDDCVRKKLYAVVALGITSSHLSPFWSCFPMVAFKNLWKPSILPLHWGEEMGEVLCSVRILLNTSVQSLFLNYVPLSVSIFFEGPNTQQMWSVYAFITSSTFLDFIGIQKVNPVSMHTAVSAYLFPLLEGGWNSPIKSKAMNSIGCGGTLKCSF